MFLLSFIGSEAQDFYDQTQQFLEKYVINNKVDYLGVSKSKELTALIEKIKSTELEQLTEAEKKAFLINSYNLLVIHQIGQNWPIRSVTEVPGFFDANTFSVGGKKITLNGLENKLIRAVYHDPRIHFVLVCGAVGCPPIISAAYKPENLGEMLDRQTIRALNDPDFIRKQQDGGYRVSEIFNWYKEDFESSNGVKGFINTYRVNKIPEQERIKYYPYNWKINDATIRSSPNSTDSQGEQLPELDNEINLQTFTAGSLLKKGQWDLTSFNSIYTESENNWQGSTFDGYRTTFATSLLQVTYGVSKNARFNIAFDVALRGSGRSKSSEAYSDIGRAFDFRNDDSTRAGVAFIAPKVRWQPFKAVGAFTIQSSYNLIVSEHPEGYTNPDGSGVGDLEWLEWNRHAWWTQFFYTKTIWNDKFQVFAEADLLFRFRRNKTQVHHLDLPTSLFFSYFPTKTITIYAMGQHTPRFVQNTMDPQINDWVIGANFSQAGLGFKYQFSSSLNVELLYSNFFHAKNAGLGETFNLGLKYLIQ